jgi:hypothetical protein
MNSMSNTLDCSTFNGDNLLKLWAQATSKYYARPAGQWALLIPSKLKPKMFTLIDNSTNKNKVYERSTPMGDELVRNGALMDFYGAGVYDSFAVWADCNDSGIYDNSTKTDSVVIFVHLPSAAMVDRRQLSSIMYDQPLKGLRNVITSWRGTWKPLQPVTDDWIGVGYNITTA